MDHYTGLSYNNAWVATVWGLYTVRVSQYRQVTTQFYLLTDCSALLNFCCFRVQKLKVKRLSRRAQTSLPTLFKENLTSRLALLSSHVLLKLKVAWNKIKNAAGSGLRSKRKRKQKKSFILVVNVARWRTYSLHIGALEIRSGYLSKTQRSDMSSTHTVMYKSITSRQSRAATY